MAVCWALAMPGAVRGALLPCLNSANPKGWFASFFLYRWQDRLRNVQPLAHYHTASTRTERTLLTVMQQEVKVGRRAYPFGGWCKQGSWRHASYRVSGREKGEGGRSSKGTTGTKTLREKIEVAASRPNWVLGIPKYKTKKLRGSMSALQRTWTCTECSRQSSWFWDPKELCSSGKGHQIWSTGAKKHVVNTCTLLFF